MMSAQIKNCQIYDLAAKFGAMSVNIVEQLKRMGGVCR
jgi:hypothetical protein